MGTRQSISLMAGALLCLWTFFVTYTGGCRPELERVFGMMIRECLFTSAHTGDQFCEGDKCVGLSALEPLVREETTYELLEAHGVYAVCMQPDCGKVLFVAHNRGEKECVNVTLFVSRQPSTVQRLDAEGAWQEVPVSLVGDRLEISCLLSCDAIEVFRIGT